MNVGLDGDIVAPITQTNTNKRLSCCDLILRALYQIIDLLSTTQTTLVTSFEDVSKPLNDIVTKGVQTSGKVNNKPTDYDIALEARKHQWVQQKMIGLHGAEDKEAEDTNEENGDVKESYLALTKLVYNVIHNLLTIYFFKL